MEQSIQSRISFTLLSEEASERVVHLLSSETSFGVQETYCDLDSSVILRVDDAVSCGALPGDVRIHDLSLVVLKRYKRA